MSYLSAVGDTGRRRWIGVLGWCALIGFFVVMLVVIAAIAFSVTVTGHSMEPTVAEGDRLLVDPFGPDDVERFDIVESSLGDREIPVIKRVIGMPGDQVQVRGDESAPVVLLRPEGQETTYVVDNPTWAGRTGVKSESCCDDDGLSLAPGEPGRWVTVPDDHYWVVGDNWGESDDSRAFGFVAKADVQALVVYRIQPFGDFGPVESDARLVERSR